MAYGFRVDFQLTGEGLFTSEKEFIEFNAFSSGLPLRLSAGIKGCALGKSKLFTLSSECFQSKEDAEIEANKVSDALLLLSPKMKCGLNLGQYAFPTRGALTLMKPMLERALGTTTASADLGITVYPLNSKPTFLRTEFKMSVIHTAQSFVDELVAIIDHRQFVSAKLKVAAAFYALSRFAENAPPARLILLYIAIESLLEPVRCSPEAEAHVDLLINTTKNGTLSEEEKKAICSTLSFLKKESIARTARSLAEKLLGGQFYDRLSPGEFFSKIYKVRNNLVHRGIINAESLHLLVIDIDHFVSDLIASYAAMARTSPTHTSISPC
jgi:hypothetical protein